MYSEGKHEKLFKHGTIEENARKESILREVTNAIARKSARVFSRPSAFLENVKERKILGQKRRKMDGNGGGSSILLGGNNGNSSSGQQLDSETFRARVLELIESKIQFDMEQRVKENELREQEFDLQKRFLEYLQSK
jgi:hypothetical protein